MRVNAQKYHLDTSRVATVDFSAGGQLSTLLGCTGDNPQLEENIGTLGHSTKVNSIVDIDGILAFIHPESGGEMIVKERLPQRIGLAIL